MMMNVRLDYSNTANYIICIDPFDLRFYYIKIVHLELNYEILYPIFRPTIRGVLIVTLTIQFILFVNILKPASKSIHYFYIFVMKNNYCLFFHWHQ
jgi:hypothetical protein